MPIMASESPSAGDGNLIGNLIRNQEKNDRKAIRQLAAGTDKYFPIFIGDRYYFDFISLYFHLGCIMQLLYFLVDRTIVIFYLHCIICLNNLPIFIN